MASTVRYPIPPSFIDFAFKLTPIVIAVIGSLFRLNDYVFSGSLLRAANLKSCCDTFDFIIVGGGSAGSAIAARLSEDQSIKILLLDADGDPNPFTYLPAGVIQTLKHPETDWDYKTVPQNGSALGLVNQQVNFPRGRGLGGSSNINVMIYNRGNPRDFDRWAQVTGDARWNYENVEKYFHKIEDYNGYWSRSGYHGKGGPLSIESVNYAPGLNYVLDAAKEMGFEIRDMNQD
ncbi:unnamed protein product [Orchesella dallaii]|uniref:Glucose-methanol-choline oxidoreductase N-terminal domain-containing protein n=1 Tax=Orchesella dallaii TaxID=48710 RepID=A0ABP1QBV8_9HEXA